jgi:arylsulfatase
MERDRTELNDLAREYPERVRELTAKWEAYAIRARVLPWVVTPPYVRSQP